MPGTVVLLLAAIFLLAAGAKLRDLASFGAVLLSLVPPPLVQPVSLLIPAVEILLAAFLLSGVAPQKALFAAITLLLVFTLILAEMWRRGLKGCACFGENARAAGHGDGLIRNALLIALAAWSINQPGLISIFGPDLSFFVARATVVLGALCLWPCLVTLVQRRRFLFPN